MTHNKYVCLDREVELWRPIAPNHWECTWYLLPEYCRAAVPQHFAWHYLSINNFSSTAKLEHTLTLMFQWRQSPKKSHMFVSVIRSNWETSSDMSTHKIHADSHTCSYLDWSIIDTCRWYTINEMYPANMPANMMQIFFASMESRESRFRRFRKKVHLMQRQQFESRWELRDSFNMFIFCE